MDTVVVYNIPNGLLCLSTQSLEVRSSGRSKSQGEGGEGNSQNSLVLLPV